MLVPNHNSTFFFTNYTYDPENVFNVPIPELLELVKLFICAILLQMSWRENKLLIFPNLLQVIG